MNWQKNQEKVVCTGIHLLVGRDLNVSKRALDQEENRTHEMKMKRMEDSGKGEHSADEGNGFRDEGYLYPIKYLQNCH